MADISFNCPKCRERLETSDDMRGESVECPACKTIIQIPLRENLRLQLQTKSLKTPKGNHLCPSSNAALLDAALKENIAAQSSKRKKNITPTVNPDDSVAKCPKCGCTSIQGAKAGYDAGMGCLSWILLGPLGLLCGACGNNTMYSHCLKCGHKWKLG
jgi:hypothetical protein